MVGVTGIEPVTSSLSGMRSNQLSYTPELVKRVKLQGESYYVYFPLFTFTFRLKQNGGGKRDRTDDLLNANQALSQLSYTPVYL